MIQPLDQDTSLGRQAPERRAQHRMNPELLGDGRFHEVLLEGLHHKLACNNRELYRLDSFDFLGDVRFPILVVPHLQMLVPPIAADRIEATILLGGYCLQNLGRRLFEGLGSLEKGYDGRTSPGGRLRRQSGGVCVRTDVCGGSDGSGRTPVLAGIYHSSVEKLMNQFLN